MAIEQQDLEKGQTLILHRNEVPQVTPEDFSEDEKAMMLFASRLAVDTNIAGFALSNMRDGGLYTHFFVNAGLGSKVGKDANRKTLDTVNEAFQLLGKSSGRRVGYSSFTHLGKRSFEEVEKKFRAEWDIGDPNNPFQPYPNSAELDLLAIIKFE